MDSGTLIVSAVFMAICLLPFIIIGRGHRKLKRKFKNLLSLMAEKSGCKLSESDMSGNFGIGIDENHNKVYFVRKTNDVISEKEVSLTDIRNCKLKSTTTFFEGGDKVIEQIELEFYNKDSDKPVEVFNLYNADTDSSTLTGELQAAEKWERILMGALKKVSVVRPLRMKSKAVV